ncbi:hypothetical protein SCHIN_v1c08440 [Spiroplasma chinense]|uniref:Uncharacterized protein n=1 Tax=Spiroplasma chinense TaxID=216932 RepID=A0A5B9Y5R0_9MOLU|nr:hypothetical protein [Spiroplasma chinense]QEH62039.1 hypothetical protein SCHIN_v1c08440 [Spiroplasma chinense]
MFKNTKNKSTAKITFSVLLAISILGLLADLGLLFRLFQAAILISIVAVYFVYQFRMWKMIRKNYNDLKEDNFSHSNASMDKREIKILIYNLIFVIFILITNFTLNSSHQKTPVFLEATLYFSIIWYLALKIELAKGYIIKRIITSVLINIWKLVSLLIKSIKTFGTKIIEMINKKLIIFSLKVKQVFLINKGQQQYSIKMKNQIYLSTILNGDYL